MSKLNTLFDCAKFEKRKQANQSEFEELNKQLLIDFKSYVPLCFENLHKKVLSVIEPIDQDKNLNSIVMSGFLKGQLIRKYAQYCYKATRQRFKLFVNNENIYVKKLDSSTKLPSNIPTDESLKIHNQLTVSDSDSGGNIFLGYSVSEDWSLITGVYATCIEGEKIIWITDLTTFGEDEQTAPVIPMSPTPITPKVKEGAKKIKTKLE